MFGKIISDFRTVRVMSQSETEVAVIEMVIEMFGSVVRNVFRVAGCFVESDYT